MSDHLCGRFVAVALCVIVGLTAAPGCALAAEQGGKEKNKVRVERVNFHGWRQAYLLTNGETDVVFVPQVARIMKYAPTGGENMLWINEMILPERPVESKMEGWQNYGGYKLWPAPQRNWGWPPPPALDGGECSVQVGEDGALTVTGQASEDCGIRFDRRIELAPEGSRLQVRQTMVNVSDNPVTWAIWDVTQVSTRGVGFIPLAPGAECRFASLDEGNEHWTLLDNMLLARRVEGSDKVFVSGPPGCIGSVEDGLLYLKTFDMPKQAPPQPEAVREIYVGDIGYMELEVVGPEVTLQPGESASLTEVWRLLPFQEKPKSDKELANLIQQKIEPVLAAEPQPK
ncbi:MAG: DUF4380 domain-containing protein [Planctomycetes bacterium]|nr:DUF4380 domain-containing protein [Planctomycetota bacterium]